MAQSPVKLKPSDFTPFKRKLDYIQYKRQGSGSLPLLRDSTVKRFWVHIFGSYRASWASGTPVSSPDGAFALVDSFEVGLINPRGQRLVKSISPRIAQRQSLFLTGQFPERRGQVGAAPVLLPNAETPAPFGTTAQYTSVDEWLEISFEDRFAAGNTGQNTILDLRDATTANFKINFRDMPSLQRADDTTAVTYDNIDINFEIIPVGESFVGNPQYDIVESFKSVPFSGEGRALIELPVSNAIRSLMLLVKDGDSARSYSNTVIGDMAIKAGGRTLWEGNFRDVQVRNKNEMAGLNVPIASAKSLIDGTCLIDLTNTGILETALDLSQIKQAYLEVYTAQAGSGATYTNIPELLLHISEVVKK